MNTQQRPQESDKSIDRAASAFAETCFPCNPLPFCKALADHVRAAGTDSIRSDRSKAILWILMAQAYGQMARIDLCDEWERLYKLIPEEQRPTTV